MATTSIHLSKQLLEQLDRLAKELGRSRNRVIVEACQALVARRSEQWPPGFLKNDHLTPEELAELREAADDLQHDIESARRSKTEAPF